jgi:hypothetical protein
MLNKPSTADAADITSSRHTGELESGKHIESGTWIVDSPAFVVVRIYRGYRNYQLRKAGTRMASNYSSKPGRQPLFSPF